MKHSKVFRIRAAEAIILMLLPAPIFTGCHLQNADQVAKAGVILIEQATYLDDKEAGYKGDIFQWRRDKAAAKKKQEELAAKKQKQEEQAAMAAVDVAHRQVKDNMQALASDAAQQAGIAAAQSSSQNSARSSGKSKPGGGTHKPHAQQQPAHRF